MNARERWRVRLGLETGGPGWKVQGPPAPLSAHAELALLAVRELRRELRVRPERDDPQAALIDRLTADEILELLGPSWDGMSGPARDAYGSPDGRPAVPTLRRDDPWEAKRKAYRAAATPFDLASRKLRHRRGAA